MSEQRRIHGQRVKGKAKAKGILTLTVGELRERHLENVKQAHGNKPATFMYYRDVLSSVGDTWPELWAKDVRHVGSVECLAWSTRYLNRYSATRYNGAIIALRAMFQIAIDEGCIALNPAMALKRARPTSNDLMSTCFQKLIVPFHVINILWIEFNRFLVELISFSKIT